MIEKNDQMGLASAVKQLRKIRIKNFKRTDFLQQSNQTGRLTCLKYGLVNAVPPGFGRLHCRRSGVTLKFIVKFSNLFLVDPVDNLSEVISIIMAIYPYPVNSTPYNIL